MALKNLLRIFKKNPEKSQMVLKNLQIDELCPMKHESHNFAWLGTSKTETIVRVTESPVA